MLLHTLISLAKDLFLLEAQLMCVFPQETLVTFLAAVYAKTMGVPIRKFICASNQNHVLTDFIKTGHYDIRERKLAKTFSPAIDILKSSNLETTFT